MSQASPEAGRPTTTEELAADAKQTIFPGSTPAVDDAESCDTASAADAEPSAQPPGDYLARPMFWLGFLYLLFVSGLVHRFGQPEVTQIEREILLLGVLLLYPFFVAEGLYRIFTPRRWIRRRREFGRFLLVLLFPPLRMGHFSQTRPNHIWLPFLGWQKVDHRLVRRVDKIFSVPMILFAALLLPILVIEYTKQDLVRAEPLLALGLQIGVATIWTAFAFEFVIKISIAPKTLVYLRERWIDLAIVVLPMFEFLLTHWVDAAPLARLLRLSRAISPEQLAQLARLYRLRGLLMRAWHAFMILEVVSRLLGNSEERRIAKLRAQIDEKHREIAALEEQIAELRQRIERREQRKALREQRRAARRRKAAPPPHDGVAPPTPDGAAPTTSPTASTTASPSTLAAVDGADPAPLRAESPDAVKPN